MTGRVSSFHSWLRISAAAALFAVPIAVLTAPPAAIAASGADACAITTPSKLVVNVRSKGAKGDGRADDTKAVQKAIDAVAGTGGTVYVPNGVFMVRGIGKNTLMLKSKMTLKLADRAVLKVIPNGSNRYAVLKIANAAQVNVTGGTLQGDRTKHKAKGGEHGMGIYIGPGARRVTIAGVTARDMWGDGFYLRDSVNIALCGVSAIHNRRQGLSIISGNNILVTRSEFRETRGTAPSAGIDIEPNKADETVRNVRIEHSKLIDNAGSGFLIQGSKGVVRDVLVLNNLFEGPEPIRIKRAPNIRSTQICKNRYVTKQLPDSGGLNKYAEPVDVVIHQSDCSDGLDMRFGKNKSAR